jgi:hypothetical protein
MTHRADPYSIHLTGRAGTGRTSEDGAGYDMEVVRPDDQVIRVNAAKDDDGPILLCVFVLGICGI